MRAREKMRESSSPSAAGRAPFPLMAPSPMDSKIFSLEEARARLEEVREKTAFADERLRALRAQQSRVPPGSSRARKLGEWINTVINEWAEEIMEMGALPKGLWTVDFDSGEGFYFCWTLDEPDINHFHRYEEGYAGRKLLTEMGAGEAPPLLN